VIEIENEPTDRFEPEVGLEVEEKRILEKRTVKTLAVVDDVVAAVGGIADDTVLIVVMVAAADSIVLSEVDVDVVVDCESEVDSMSDVERW